MAPPLDSGPGAADPGPRGGTLQELACCPSAKARWAPVRRESEREDAVRGERPVHGARDEFGKQPGAVRDVAVPRRPRGSAPRAR